KVNGPKIKLFLPRFSDMAKKTSYIKDLSTLEGQDISLQGWVSNRRDSKGLVFLILRDGSGLCQCIVDINVVGNDKFEQAKRLGIESSLSISGKIVRDERQIGGME